MKKVKEIYLPDDNFTEAIPISTDLNTIDISSILQTVLNEKGIEGTNAEEVLANIVTKLGVVAENSEYKWEEITTPSS